MKILFLGTPDFAVESLKILVEHQYEIVGVVTAPDKPSGRGLEIHETPVKKYAKEVGLKIFQPEKLKSPEFIESLKELEIDLGIVVAFRMLPEMVWNLPKMGTFNLHASLLPNYRGSAPINWAIIHGEKETGVTTFFLKHEIDTGDILLQKKVEIGADETAGELYDRLMHKGAELVLETMHLIEKGNYSTIPQVQNTSIHQAPKLYKETACIDFSKLGREIYNFIRGMNPFPGAWFMWNQKKIIIYKCTFNSEVHTNQLGEIATDYKTYFRVFCADGYIEILELKMEGKKQMKIVDFLNGIKR
ncbi:MAG: methionyl-tRNA formyltransferase [Bacteroidetes bacterium]|nr:methionyl-tRNA formyltransferase [Bacteroidota bacterium]